ncbi:SatD family protein [Faecalimonas sp.]
MFFFFFSKPYISIVGEIFPSKEMEERKKQQKKLYSILEKINQEHEEDISAKFMPTIENEFQGLASKGCNLMRVLLEIKNELYPYKVRFGIGIGEVEPDFQSENAITISGLGYEKARESLKILQNRDAKKQKTFTDIHLEVVGEQNERVHLMNTIFSLLTTIESSWSNRQREIIYHMLKYQDTQSTVAKRFGVTQSTIQKTLTAGKYYAYEEAVSTLERIFSEIGDEQ